MIKKFTTNLHVDKKIVSLLSTSTYQKSFSSSIRELISNAYDADALSVNITIKDNYKTIEIEDDGNGMTREEFEKYLTIGKNKSLTQFTRKYKRKRIGQFGVGFLSIFPFCEELEIITTVENSDSILSARIPTVDYEDSGKPKSQPSNVEDIPINGVILDDKSQRLKHYTKIKLINPSHAIKQYFSKAKTKKRESIETMDPDDKFKWELQEDLPISYDREGKSFKSFKYEEPIGINIFLNKKLLSRNELMTDILDSGTKIIEGIKCQYIFTTNYKSVTPLEARGVKRRVNNVGIGPRTDFELKRDRGFSRLHWLTGEIHFSEEIKEFLTVARDNFVASPVIDEINNFFAEKLRNWAYYVEQVAVAEKEIEKTVLNTKKGRAIPKEEIIDNNVNKLAEKGFKIIKIAHDPTKGKSSDTTIKVDKARKTVVIRESEDYKKDFVSLVGKKYEVVFSDDFDSADTPCKFKNEKTIMINRNYTLFNSKSYGKVYQKIHMLLLVAQNQKRTSKEMYDLIIENFSQEFNDTK